MKNLTSRALAFGSVALVIASLGCGSKLLGIAPSISVSPTNLAFPNTTVGTSSIVTVQVTNEGSAALQINSIRVATNPNNELSVSGLLTTDCSGNSRSGSTTLAPAECAQFVTTWAPTAVHMAEGTVEIDSSDTQNPAVTLVASGTAVANTCQCTAGQSCCDQVCIETQGSDVNHCGGCNTVCPAQDTCVSGVCTPPVITPPPDAGPSGCDSNSECSGSTICCNRACVASATGLCPCTGTGTTSGFDINTIIIPMDECFQPGKDVTSRPSYCDAANSSPVPGNDAPLKAYGLVYFLLKHGVTVYSIIDPNKTTIDGVDLSMTTLDGTAPVKKYNWATGAADTLPDNTQNTIGYRGAPFLIDSSQHDKVLALFASDPDFAQFKTAATITIHIANEGFQTVIAKSLNAVPSRIALLLPSGQGDSSYGQILVNYLDSAGLNFAGAGGTSSAPGTVYDQLQLADFLPNYAGSALKANGYQLLWSPHWDGADSSADTQSQLATIGAYVNAGGDLFAECAAIATLEGWSGGGGGGGHGGGGGAAYPGSAATRFMTTTGIDANNLTTNFSGTIPGPFAYGGITNFLSQIGDFSFFGVDGAITDFHPAAAYNTGVLQLISKTSGGVQNDIFTSLDGHAQGKGSVVYLSGHDYSYNGENDTPGVVGITAGSRLVLNTLFSLGANDVCTSN